MKRHFNVTVNGYPIQKYPFPNGTGLQIVYDPDSGFEGQQARMSAGISLESWEQMAGDTIYATPERPTAKSDVIALWRLNRMIAAVQANEQNRKKRR